jgi:molybdopterin-guanine dinucleotide biosynthesis protein A
MWTAAILAGGAGRRWGGRDKSALIVDSEPILDHQISVLSEITDRILIIASEGERYRSRGVRVVNDLIAGAGALGGIYTALCAASTDHTLVVACDMPFLSAPFLSYVVAALRHADAAVPRTSAGYEPLCAAYASSCIAGFRQRVHAGALKVTDALADLRIREIAPDEIKVFDPDGSLFFNVNTADDYRRACRIVTLRRAQSLEPQSRDAGKI